MMHTLVLLKDFFTKPYAKIAIAVCALLFFTFSSARAQGDLLIFPKRIVFDGSKKSQQLNLANSGRDTGRYIISVVQVRMKEDGGFETITQNDSGQLFADKFFRVFPRHVVLAPNEAQMVKIQLTNVGQLLPGEYRSHLYFRAEPEKIPLGEEGRTKDTGSISVKLVAVFGITLPVLIKVGESNTAVSFSDVVFRMTGDTVPTINMTFNRAGNMSTYGDVTVDHVSQQGKVTRVGVIKGISVYTPNTLRRSQMALDNKAGVDYRSGKLHLVYTDQGVKGKLLAETEVHLHGSQQHLSTGVSKGK